ncbi:SusC/RagA family TonB-linked outer membrane protein [Rubrolithibacter danxiaensis]|uniref:SusC/RagA family TonB-linked outer membrane protein n=1 Tax=Rubrolithibacter danxiaensis TaxID=3390805 RepID=UPI003BF90A86
MSISAAIAQNIPVKGVVTDAAGEPLVGVSIKVSGTTAGTTTDVNGAFSINAPSNGTLVFTYIGYTTKSVAVNGQSSLNVKLASEAKALDQVVVTGYQSQRKKDITGSVAVVDVNQMTSVPSGSTSQLLQGQASGVVVLAAGQPGQEANIFIRGVSSFGNTKPLVIVDGVQAGLNDINPNDIASVQVLKDAGAASIYGVRGANGVIVVTTKKGKSGAPKITYDAYYGQVTPPSGNVFNLMNPSEMATVFNRVDPNHAIYAGGKVPEYIWVDNAANKGGYAAAGSPAVDPAKYRFDPVNPANNYQIARSNQAGTDWFHEIFSSAPVMNHSLTASGGTENATYLFSLNYLNEQGTLMNTYNKRYGTRINTTFNIGKSIRVGENAYLYYKNSPGIPGGNQNEGNAISFAYRMQSFIPVYDIQGNYAGTRLGTGEMGNGQNPVAMQDAQRNNKQNFWQMQGNIFAEVDLIKGLTARTSFGGSIGNNYYYNFGFPNYWNREGFSNPNSFSENASYYNDWTWTNTLNYSKVIGTHNIKILAGTEAVNSYGRDLGGSINSLFSTDPNFINLDNGSANETNYSHVNNNDRLFSLFGRVDYSFQDKYLIGATIRRDGSSRFGSEKRYGVFPAVSLGWRISQEAFMKNIAWLNDLKLRGSWGKMGSYANTPNRNAYNIFGGNNQTAYYPIGGGNGIQQGFLSSDLGNPATGWEEDIVTNAGFDATILNNHVTLSAEWYKKKINGLLFRESLPYTVGGATAPYVNLGDIQNTGLDVSVGYNSSQSKDFKYNVGVNFTTYDNKIISVPGNFFETSGSRIGNLIRNQVGHPVASFYGYQVQGLFRDSLDVLNSPTQGGSAPGRFKYKDVDGDGAVTDKDRTFIGNPNPDFTYGINIGASYKNFDLSTVLFGSQGNQALNYTKYWTDFLGSFVGGKSKALLTAWEPVDRSAPRGQWVASNPNATTPVAESASTISNSGAMNSYYVEDASFLKMRSLQIGYTIPATALSRLGISRLRVYVQGANLFTITKYSGMDPELVPSSGNLGGDQQSAGFGVDYGNYPNNQKSFLFGVNLTL